MDKKRKYSTTHIWILLGITLKQITNWINKKNCVDLQTTVINDRQIFTSQTGLYFLRFSGSIDQKSKFINTKARHWTFFLSSCIQCRSQWPRGLRHELSSPVQTLGSWVRIPLETWMSLCVYSVFVLSCVQVAALRRADRPCKESYRLCKRSKTKKAAKAQQGAVEP
jgi:hypothetical protein